MATSETAERTPVDGQPSSKQWEQIKEKLKSAWHRKDPASFDRASFISAASEAGVTDASTLADMIQYAAHASQVPVKRSGQSAFSWVPLVAVAAFAQSKAAPERRADVVALTVQALVSVGREAESDGVMEGEGVPGDLKAAAEHIDGVMVSMRKASRIGLAGASFGRLKSLKDATSKLSSALESLKCLPEDQQSDTAAVQKAFKRVVTEVEASRQLCKRAVDSLAGTEPQEGHSPALTAVSQGPVLEKELADMKSTIQEADTAVDAAKEALKESGMDPGQMIQEAKEERRERLASRPERPRGGDRRRRNGRRGRGRPGAADGSTAEDESAEDTDQDQEDATAADGAMEAAEVNGGRSGGSRQRRSGRTRGGEHRRNRGGGGRDYTAPRDAATDDEEDAAEGGAEGGASPSGRTGPPGFSPRHGDEEGVRAEGERRRRGGRGRRVKAEGNDGCVDASVGAVGEAGGTGQADEGGRKGSGRRRGGRGRKPRGAAADAEAADAPGAAGAVADGGPGGGRPGGARAPRGSLQTYDNPAFADADGAEGATNAAEQEDDQVERPRKERRKRPSLKDVARILEAIKLDLCDPITKAPLRDPVAAADGYTYERTSIEAHLATHRMSPVTGEPLQSTVLFPSALASSLLERLADCNPA